MFNEFPDYMAPQDQQAITVGGRYLCELNARITEAVIGSCDPDVEIFQGIGRSSVNVLKNRRTGRQLRLTIDFIGPPLETIRNRAEFELLFLGLEPVEINLQDGYYYDAVLLSIRETTGIPGICTSVQYTFAATKRGGRTNLSVQVGYSAPGVFYCPGTYPKSDCIIRIKGITGGRTYGWWVEINGLNFTSKSAMTGDVEINGVDKIITMDEITTTGGSIVRKVRKNITGSVEWTEFPYAVPGENTVEFALDGLSQDYTLEVEYAPVYL